MLLAVAHTANAQPDPAREGDVHLRDFRFRSGEMLPDLRIHYLALGSPRRNARGGISNAILVLHGTGGTGRQFLSPQFAEPLYGEGAPLDTTRWWVVLPDGIGHGRSSKPSDGLHMRFPAYDYDDMVEAHRQALRKLGVYHLRLVMGTSMGGMQTFVWGVEHPDWMDALMALACLPAPIAGRNRVWRKMAMDAIRNDPDWQDGEYTSEPVRALRTAEDLLLLVGGAPLAMQATLASRDSADRWVERQVPQRIVSLDANDLLYQLAASRNYDPSPDLGKIQVPLVHVNSADDFINPPELGIAEREIRKVPEGRFVLIPASAETHGHGTHTWAVFWKDELGRLLARTRPTEPGLPTR
jgi:homoserine O-acetyltransferase